MMKKIGVAFTLLLISSFSVNNTYESNSNATTYSLSIGIQSAYAGTNDWDDEDDDWEEEYDEWEEEMDRFETVGEQIDWDQYEFEAWLDEQKDEENDDEDYEYQNEDSGQSKTDKEKCTSKAEQVRTDCIALYGGTGVTLATACKWIEGRTGAIFGTACSGTVALGTVQAYRWCNTQADSLVARCE